MTARRLILAAVLLLGGCLHAPDRLTVSYQQDPNDRGDQKVGVALSFPITYGPAR